MIERLIRRLGEKYMPPNAIHFDQLLRAERDKLLEHAPILRENHFGWRLFSNVARTATTWWVPFPPRKIQGNAEEVTWVAEDGSEHLYCKPIPKPGQWFENPGKTPDIVGYRAETGPGGQIDRKGARFDDVDGYMTWPAFRAGSVTDFFRRLFRG